MNGDIYAKIQYNYAPDENMEPLNDAESTIAVEELMTPIVEMLVVRTENLETDEVKEEMDFFKSVEKIGVKGDFCLLYTSNQHAQPNIFRFANFRKPHLHERTILPQ